MLLRYFVLFVATGALLKLSISRSPRSVIQHQSQGDDALQIGNFHWSSRTVQPGVWDTVTGVWR